MPATSNISIIASATKPRQGAAAHNARYLRMLNLVGAAAAMISLGLMFVP